jgi:hypothetical protein
MPDNNMSDAEALEEQIRNAIEAARMSCWITWMRRQDPVRAETAFRATLRDFLRPLKLDQSTSDAANRNAEEKLKVLLKEMKPKRDLNELAKNIDDAIEAADTSYRAAFVVHKTKHIHSTGEWNKDSVDAVRAFYNTLLGYLVPLELTPSEASAALRAAEDSLANLSLAPEEELLPNNHE